LEHDYTTRALSRRPEFFSLLPNISRKVFGLAVYYLLSKASFIHDNSKYLLRTLNDVSSWRTDLLVMWLLLQFFCVLLVY